MCFLTKPGCKSNNKSNMKQITNILSTGIIYQSTTSNDNYEGPVVYNLITFLREKYPSTILTKSIFAVKNQQRLGLNAVNRALKYLCKQLMIHISKSLHK